ncbi:MAG: PASTA domain-containing protein, partial [Alistipes sp.]|nr:PASTA domain-containing protein [Alistipes sp.]
TGTTKAYFTDTTSYRVASKTGTANVAQNGSGGGATYSEKYYLGSVVAYFPADKPKYTVQVSIHTQRGRGVTYGGPLAGPVVRDIVRYIYFRDEDWHQQIAQSDKEHYPPTVKGGSIANVRRVADKFSPRVSFTDREGWGVARADTLRNINVKTIEDNSLMPNVVGMGLKDALYILESRGLRVQFSGKGSVRQQSIPVGAKISAGASVSLTLR